MVDQIRYRRRNVVGQDEGARECDWCLCNCHKYTLFCLALAIWLLSQARPAPHNVCLAYGSMLLFFNLLFDVCSTSKHRTTDVELALTTDVELTLTTDLTLCRSFFARRAKNDRRKTQSTMLPQARRTQESTPAAQSSSSTSGARRHESQRPLQSRRHGRRIGELVGRRCRPPACRQC